MGYGLRMSDEIRGWIVALCRDRPRSATLVGRALMELMRQGADLGTPLVIPVTGPEGPAHPLEALEQAHQDRLERLTEVRRGLADATVLAKDIERHIADLAAQRDQSDGRLDEAAGRVGEAAEAKAARRYVAAQMAELERLLPGVRGAEEVLAARAERMQALLDAFRSRKETLKARYVAEQAARAVREVIAASELMPAEPWQQRADLGATRPSDLGDIAKEIERELGPAKAPDGLMELRPANLVPGGAMSGRDEDGEDIRILFAAEPAGTALLIAVLDGQDAVRERYRDAVGISAVALRRVRAGQDQEASACAFDDEQAFIGEFFPGEFFPGEITARSPATFAPDARRMLSDQRSRLGLSERQIAARMGVAEQRVTAIEQAEPGDIKVGDLALYIAALGGSMRIVAEIGGEQVMLGGLCD